MPSAKALAAGRAWGRKLDSSLEAVPADPASADDAIDHLVNMLDELGFAPERRAAGGEQQVGLRHCPFLELAENRTAVVCPVHLGLMQGAMEAWGAPVSVDRLDAFVEPDLCVAHLAPQNGGQVSTGPAIAVALTFVWLGMVLAISFLEAPLKFRAPNVTLQIGLGIGRLVFRALNTVEVGFALVVAAIVVAGPTPARVAVAIFVAVGALAVAADRGASPVDAPIRQRARRSRRAALPRPITCTSGFEVVKVIALGVAGILLLTA